uniref:Uncharacterized protein n=1 Tax=Peronospora matthiolae TaxID=2874970 RepID=A0AAV1UEC9_9STRA
MEAKDEEGMTMFVAERQHIMEVKDVVERSARETGGDQGHYMGGTDAR